jgi:hypothetical protein
MKKTFEVHFRSRFFFVAVLGGLAFTILSCSSSGSADRDEWSPRYVQVKYRSDPVDVAAPYFKPLRDRNSSFVNAAWYDSDNRYMVIVLNGVAYHYCGLGSEVWSAFSTAPSRGVYYTQAIRGRFDCRVYQAPNYP